MRSEIERCQREIADARGAILAGNPDISGLCLALADWSVELRILQSEHATHVWALSTSCILSPCRSRSYPRADSQTCSA
jgi:hypothetical protein